MEYEFDSDEMTNAEPQHTGLFAETATGMVAVSGFCTEEETAEKLDREAQAMDKLRPCPFCGGDALDVGADEYWSARDYVPYAFVTCVDCGTRGPIAHRGTMSEKECRMAAMREWNERMSEE